MTITKQGQQSNFADEGNNGKGGDDNGNGNSNSDGNGNDADAAANSNNVDDKCGSNSRMAFGQRQLDDNDGMTRM